jgi:hypothetical protein
MTVRIWPRVREWTLNNRAQCRLAARYRTLGRGVFHCERCGGDRPYRHLRARIRRTGRPGVSEHLRCAICGTCYRVELLAVPTTDQMLDALLAGTTAAVLAMLAAGDQASDAASQRAVETIRNAGAPDYDLARLALALSEAAHGQVAGLRAAAETFAVQLEVPAREWFLAGVVQVGLADGSLSDGQRAVAGLIARYLGLTQAMARAVIAAMEEAAQAG